MHTDNDAHALVNALVTDAIETVETPKAKRTRKPRILPDLTTTPETLTAAPLADATAARVERISAARAIASTVYNGPSLAVHASNRNPKAQAAFDRVREPVQKAASPTVRDLSALRTAKAHATADHVIEPATYGADLGTLSRLASLGLIGILGADIVITERGLATSC